MRRVIMLSGTAKNYHPAEEFGEVHFVKLSSKDMLNIPRHIADIYDSVFQFRTEPKPYVVISGYGLYSALLLVVCFEIWGEVDLLIWDAKKEIYNPAYSPLSMELINDYRHRVLEGGI